MHGAGPATVLRAAGSEAAIVFEDCDEVEVRALRAQGGGAGAGTGDLDGALTFLGCTDVLVARLRADLRRRRGARADVRDGAPERGGATPTASASSAAGSRSGRARSARCSSTPACAVSPTTMSASRSRPAAVRRRRRASSARGSWSGALAPTTVQVVDNLVEDAVQGIHVGVSDGSTPNRDLAGEVVVHRNVVHLLVPADYDRERHAVFVGNARSVHVKDTVASLTRVGAGTPTLVEAIRVFGQLGPFVVVRQTSLSGFPVGVSVRPLDPIPNPRVWLVAETMAAGGVLAVDAPAEVDSDEHNAPMPAPPAIDAVTLDVAAVGGGAIVAGQVRLTSPARAGGVTVTLSSSNAAAANVPAGVTIAPGALAAAFSVTTRAVTADANVTITAAFSGVTRTAALLVRAAATAGSVVLSPPSLVGGTGSSTGTVTLTGDAPAGGAAVALSSANPPIASPRRRRSTCPPASAARTSS